MPTELENGTAEPVAEAMEVQEVVAEELHGDSDEEQDVLEAVVVDEEEEETPALSAAPVATAQVAAEEPKVVAKKKTPKKKKNKRSFGAIAVPESMQAARDAREMLQGAVGTLPTSFGEFDTVVRSFGRIPIDADMLKSKFATTTSIYPVGFSCDRFEFSPVHGRNIKVRCWILDGRKIKEKQREGGFAESAVHDGPVFRIMWGRGVDEAADDVQYPYDPQTNSAPLTNDVDTLAIADPSDSSHKPLVPEVGMRVKVRFEQNQYFAGTVEKVEEDAKKRRKAHMITIRYDGGWTEEIAFPDPDVLLLLPGLEDEIDSEGNVELTQVNGKPVECVVGETCIGAWGNALVRLGLIDEMILETSMDALKNARENGIKEANEKVRGKKERRDSNADSVASSAGPMSVDGDAVEPDGATSTEVTSTIANGEDKVKDDSEPPSAEELALREKAERLLVELQSAVKDDQESAVRLADARIGLLGPFFCNPFQLDEQSRTQQISWLATAVRKEKMKMGSTGNRKKVVTAVDLLERNDTLYNPDIEAMIEGLPGSEYCSSYVFHAFRPGYNSVLNRAWLHEAQLRREREAAKRLERTKELEMKEHQSLEKRKKRKLLEDFRDARKRQKLEEEDQKKKARIDERMSRLRVQVEERLLNEANSQREKAVTALARSLAKEFVRRRKAAELVASQAVVESKGISLKPSPEGTALKALSQEYEEDTLRVWDFISTFGSFFVERGYISEVPTLDSLQSSVDSLRKGKTVVSRAAAVSSLTDLAVALCKPLAASLTRVLFASLIALNPTLQKDFGAAFFNEVNATSGKEDSDESSHPDVLLPVNSMTWQEIARVSLLSDALGELGHQRHEAAHILRGYRSAGHPNSKEARRLRKAEDFWVALVRQEVELGDDELPNHHSNRSVRVDVPCRPFCTPTDFRFFLHNIKSFPDASLREMRTNFEKAMGLLDNKTKDEPDTQDEMDQIRRLMDECKGDGGKGARKVKNAILKLLEKVSGPASKKFALDAADGLYNEPWPWQEATRNSTVDIPDDQVLRERMGQLKFLSLSKDEYKKLATEREVYMEEALRFKEAEKRKQEKTEDDEEDDDEDDEEDDASRPEILKKGESPEKEPSENGESGSPKVGNGTRKVGKPTEFDEFCGDIPTAPEHIRRCLAVLRSICATGQAAIFLNPADPQSNPGYYDTVLRPVCLRQIGKQLQSAAEKASEMEEPKRLSFVEDTVAEFGRSVRRIVQNTLCYANAGPTVVSMGTELLRIFERLFFDWVLAPEHALPRLDQLDDDKCVEHHESDEQSTVLFCDGCEGKYNITRLDPPLSKVPKGDWYCPRCISGRWWGSLDPRIGKTVRKASLVGDEKTEGGPEFIIRSCLYRFPEDAKAKPSLMYAVEQTDGGTTETWSLEEVDSALSHSGKPVPPIPCLEAVAESPGYGCGVGEGLRKDLVPVPLNPAVSDAAAQVSISSSVFRDTIFASGSLLVIDPRDMTPTEWLRLLVLLTMKCSSSDVLQNVVSKMENAAAERMATALESAGKVKDAKDILPDLPFDTSDEDLLNRDEATPYIVEVETIDSKPLSSNPKVSESPHQMNGNGPSPVVEASAIEVIVDGATVPGAKASDASVEAAEVTEVPAENVPVFSEATNQKRLRRKAIEDSFAGYSLKNQLRSTVASFQEDFVSRVVDASMGSKIHGLDFLSLRCRRKLCDFCGLSDVALGTPLVRVPNEEEWTELLPHFARNRKVCLVAELSSASEMEDDGATGTPKLVSVVVRVDGDIMSVPDPDLHEVSDGGMLEFVPRSVDGFQNELLFRSDTGLPHLTGSMSAHEGCAIAAHNARKDLMVQRHREREADLIEREAAMTCGRTLEIGRDESGRSYWKFQSDQKALFVCEEAVDGSCGHWYRLGEPECIASFIVGLGKSKIASDLRRSYPEADSMIKDRSWTSAMMKRRYPRAIAVMNEGEDVVMEDGDDNEGKNETVLVAGGFEPYEVGEEVLVESKSRLLFWDASVTGVCRRALTQDSAPMIDGYRVQYTGWTSHYTEWVEPDRVVEPNENNKLLQEDMLVERASARHGLPVPLNILAAKDYLNARDRARGSTPLPDFTRIAEVRENSTPSEVTFGLMKAAALAIEAALPVGSVDNSENGVWGSRYARKWRMLVEQAKGAARLMQLVILLEDVISEEWIKPDVGHLRSCLPARWKAIGESSPSALAVRVILLDRSIMYSQIDRKRYARKAKK